LLKHRASGYALTDEGLANAAYADMSIPHGAGALYSTVEDLYLWDRALYTEKLLKRSSLKAIFNPFKGTYGYGWFVGDLFGHRRIGHSGGISGFSANISRYVDDDVCVVVLSNIEGGERVDRISRDLAAIIFGEQYEIPE